MKCPECDSVRFVQLEHLHQLLGFDRDLFIDGVPHYHDPNGHSVVYECENGHRVEIMYRVACCAKDCKFNRV